MLDTISNMPASINVAFPISINGQATSGQFLVNAPTGSGYGKAELIHSTAIAWMSTQVSTSPANLAELQALANRIALDFAGWRKALLEIRYVGAIPWVADGMHDVEYVHADNKITTTVSRSKWSPPSAVLKHAGTYGSSADWWPPKGPAVQLVDGANQNNAFDSTIAYYDPIAQAWNGTISCWAIGNPKPALPAMLGVDAVYTATFQGYGGAGPYYMAAVANPLTAPPSILPNKDWIKIVGPLEPEAWDTLPKSEGQLVSQGGSNYLALIDNTNVMPPASGTWLLISTIGTPGAGFPQGPATPWVINTLFPAGQLVSYGGTNYISLLDSTNVAPGSEGSDPDIWLALTVGAVVQLVRLLYSFDAGPGDEQEGPTIQIEDGIPHKAPGGTYFKGWLLTRVNT